jgi:hypothetical protein
MPNAERKLSQPRDGRRYPPAIVKHLGSNACESGSGMVYSNCLWQKKQPEALIPEPGVKFDVFAPA